MSKSEPAASSQSVSTSPALLRREGRDGAWRPSEGGSSGRSPAQHFAALAQGFVSAVRSAPDRSLMALLVAAALASRLFTSTLYASEPSSDEYFYGLYAIEVARTMLGQADRSVADLAGQGRFVGLLVGAAITVIPMDPLSLGRLIQVALNALTIPLTYALGRSAGLGAGASLAAASLLLVMPEMWETAWRFWPDSQAAFLALGAVLVILRLFQRPSLGLALLTPLLALATFLTKEYPAAATLPTIMAGGLLAALSRWFSRRTQPGWLLAVGLAFVLIPVVLAAVALLAGDSVRALFAPTFLGGQVNRTLSALDRVAAVVPMASQRLPDYLPALKSQLGPREFGAGFTAFWAVGALAFLGAALGVLVRRQPSEHLGWYRALWLVALLAWAPALYYGWTIALAQVERSAAGILGLCAAASLAAVGGFVGRHQAESGGTAGIAAARASWLPFGLALLGVFVTSFVLFRFTIWAPADLRAAFTPRSFQPIFAVLALVAGWGLAAVATAIAGASTARAPGRRRPVFWAVFGALLFGTLYVLSPARDHLASEFLLTYRADREGNLFTPGGLRITALVEAERWLQGNVLPADRVMTSMPRHVAWYGRSGVDGYLNSVTIGELAPDLPTRRARTMGVLARPSVVDYVIDFNLYWTHPDSSEATYWYDLYRWLQTRPYLEEVYSRRDPNGRIVFYAFRNHRWASSPSYVDREQARAAQLAAVAR